MPLGTLKKRSSARDLYRRSLIPDLKNYDAPPIPPSNVKQVNGSTSQGNKHLQPESAHPPQRPSTSHQSTTSSRPELPRRPSSPRSVQQHHLDVPRTRHSLKSASEPDIGTKYKVQARRERPPDEEEDDAAPSPMIGVTAPPREDEASEKLSRRRTLRPLAASLMNFRSTSYNAAIPQSRASDVGYQSQSPAWQPRESDSSTEDGEGHLHTDGAGPSPLRYSESSAPTRSPQRLAPARSQDKVGSKASQFFKFTRRKKQPESLFPLPVRVSPPSEPSPRPGSIASSDSPTHTHSTDDYIPPVPPIPGTAGHRPSVDITRNASQATARSSPPVTIHFHSDNRSRSGTVNSSTGYVESDRTQPHHQDSGRNSTASTTLGRNSIAGLRSLTSRLRHPSEVYTPRHGSPGGALAQSANNSFAMSRETLVVPEREEGESAGKYYQRLEEQMPKRNIALALSKSSDVFNRDVLRSLLRTFKFFEEPMDMSMRKFLWEVSLPGEAQQIDRVLSAFSERYHECNPHIFSSVDQAVFIAYSLVILHSDLFNPNNKTKMQRHQYQRNTADESIPREVLGYFYDNIVYTEFIGQNADEDDGDSKSKTASKKARRVKQKLAAPESTKNGKVDPYVIIIDDKYKLDILRPVIKDVLNLEDIYSYLGTASRFDVLNMRAAFARFGILQITSSMSRPGAFANQETMKQPFHAAPGVVDIKVAKVGILQRKTGKRKRARSPWEPWGAILTPSQLMFFKKPDWVRNLVYQAEQHQKHGSSNTACVFKPPLASLTFEGKVSTNEAVALLDPSYKTHKNAFTLARRGFAVGGTDLEQQHFEETLRADSESEMNDWIAKFNYASTFMTNNVRMHSWHPGCRVESIVEAAGQADHRPNSDASPTENMLNGGEERNLSPTARAAFLRTQMIKEKLASATEELEPKLKTVDDYIRTARHLEILAPLNDRTRSELLSFGVRLAHNIRWSRFDVARLKCYRDILFRELQEDESSTSTRGMGILDTEDRILGLSSNRQSTIKRVSQNIPTSGERSGSDSQPPQLRAVKAEGGEQRPSSYRSSDIFESIDEAFATPPETLATVEGSNTGDFKLLDLNKQANAAVAAPGSPDIQSAEDFRPSSVSSASSKPSPLIGQVTPTQSIHDVPDERRQSVTSELDLAPKNEVAGSPTSSNKSNVRRSLQRTLREPRDALSQSTSRSTRSKKHKERDSQGGEITDDASSTKGSEGLARPKGSFGLHGHKASVIKIPEWEREGKSTEERLRLRKQLASDNSKRRSADIDGLTEDDYGTDRRPSVAFSSSVTGGESGDE